MTTTTLHPGALVRLTLDQGPRSFGVILAADVTVRDDGSRVLPVVFSEDRMFAEELSCDAFGRPAAGSVPDEVDGLAVLTLPETTLTTLCEHVETHPDGWGLACSEANVPTSIDVPCMFDAARSFGFEDGDEEWDSLNLCDAHAALYEGSATR